MINQQRQGSSIDKEYIKHLTTLNEAFSDEDKDEIFSDVSEFLNEKIDKNITIATLLKSKIFNEVHKTTQVNDQHMDNLLLDKNIIIHSLAEIKEKIQNINKDTILIKKEKAIIDYSNKYINKILRDLHLLFLNNKGKNIYGDTDFAIMDHINSIRTEVNKREDITDIEKRQVKDFLLKTHKFIVFFSNSVKEFFIDNDASYKDFFMYFSGKDYEFFLNSAKEVFLKKLKDTFNKTYINKYIITKYETEYKNIFNKEIDAIKEQYPQIKINQKRLEQIYNISTALSSKLYLKIIESYNTIIEEIKKETIKYKDKFENKQHFLRSYYIEVFYYFYSYGLDDFCKKQYKDHIATTLNEELSTKIGDIKKQQEKERKREEEQSKKAENQIQQPKKQEEPKNLLSSEDLNIINNIKNLLKNEKIDQTISEDIVSYIEKMIIGEKTINIHNRVKQKKLGISDEIVKILSLYLYDRDYPIDINKFIAIDKTSTEKTPTLVQNDEDDKKTTPQEDIIGKQMVQAIEQAGDSPYDQLMAYFDYNGYQFVDREGFEKKLQYIKNEEIKPIINKIKEDPNEHKRVRHNYANSYKVMKFGITVSRLVMKNNTVIELYTDHDKRMKEKFSLIFTK